MSSNIYRAPIFVRYLYEWKSAYSGPEPSESMYYHKCRIIYIICLFQTPVRHKFFSHKPLSAFFNKNHFYFFSDGKYFGNTKIFIFRLLLKKRIIAVFKNVYNLTCWSFLKSIWLFQPVQKKKFIFSFYHMKKIYFFS